MTSSAQIHANATRRVPDAAERPANALATVVLCGAFLIAIIATIAFPSEFWGHLMAAGSFLVLLHARIRKFTSTVVTVSFALLAHHVCAYVNTYAGPLPGADQDAPGFHLTAVLLAAGENVVIGRGAHAFYTDGLSALYRLTGPSLLAGCESSVLAFAIAAILFFSLCDLLDVRRYANVLFILFAFAPPALIFTSVTLRESWQVLFTLWAVHSVLRLQERITFRRFIVFIASTILMGLLHYALTLYALAFGLAGVVWAALRTRTSRLLSIATVIVAVLLAGWFATKSTTASLRLLKTEPSEIARVINNFRLGTPVTRATYGGLLDVTSVGTAIRSAAEIVFLYWLAPLPHQIATANDAYAALEGLARAFVILGGVFAVRRMRTSTDRRRRFVFCAAIVLEIMWAFGTTNWGTSIRHRLLAYPLLLLVGGPPILRRLRPESS